jgi:hypothetical protein
MFGMKYPQSVDGKPHARSGDPLRRLFYINRGNQPSGLDQTLKLVPQPQPEAAFGFLT